KLPVHSKRKRTRQSKLKRASYPRATQSHGNAPCLQLPPSPRRPTTDNPYKPLQSLSDAHSSGRYLQAGCKTPHHTGREPKSKPRPSPTQSHSSASAEKKRYATIVPIPK